MSFLSIFLTTITLVILFINSIVLILNRFTKNATGYSNITGYGCATMVWLSFIFINPLSLKDYALTGGSSLGFGNFSILIIFMVLMLTGVILCLMKPSTLNESALLVVFSTMGLIFMIETNHFIGFYLGVELYSLSAYILASGAGTLSGPCTPGATLASSVAPSVSVGLKYFLLSALSSGVLIAGISIIYACTGELTLTGVSRMLTMMSSGCVGNARCVAPGELTGDLYNDLLLTILGIGLVISTLAFKIGSAPFHFWVPDVYSKVSLFVNFYLISVPKIGILFTLIKISLFLPVTSPLILIFSILSLAVGALGGLLQQKITRLLAYSSISHVGYILLALYGTHLKNVSLNGCTGAGYGVSGDLSATDSGWGATLIYGITSGASPSNVYSIALYLIIYSFMTLTVFSVLNVLRNSYSPITKEPYIFLSSLKNLSALNPYLAGSLAITALSMAGVPPLAGFVAKLYVYISVLDNNGLILSIFAVICSVVTAVYYLRIIKISYFYNTPLEPSHLRVPVISNFSSLLISFSTLFLVFYPLLAPSIIYMISV